jgi:ABC-type multidrug transport system ATPase subunit
MSAPSSFAASDALVTVQDTAKRYRGRDVLRVASLDLCRGDRLLITGSNGSGKSTLLRLLAGVASPTTGTVRHAPAFDDLVVAFVPQAGGALPNLTVAENLLLAIGLRGRSIPERLLERWYVSDLGLNALLHVRFGELSGGFQRLAALSCALATEPDGIFLDEPLSGVDAPHSHFVREGLLAASANMEFLALTAHAADEFDAANRVVKIVKGQIGP